MHNYKQYKSESRTARYNSNSLRIEATQPLLTREDFADFIISALFQMHVPTTLTTQNGGGEIAITSQERKIAQDRYLHQYKQMVMTILAQYDETQETWTGKEEQITQQLIECTGIPDDKLYELTITLQTTLTM